MPRNRLNLPRGFGPCMTPPHAPGWGTKVVAAESHKVPPSSRTKSRRVVAQTLMRTAQSRLAEARAPDSPPRHGVRRASRGTARAPSYSEGKAGHGRSRRRKSAQGSMHDHGQPQSQAATPAAGMNRSRTGRPVRKASGPCPRALGGARGRAGETPAGQDKPGRAYEVTRAAHRRLGLRIAGMAPSSRQCPPDARRETSPRSGRRGGRSGCEGASSRPSHACHEARALHPLRKRARASRSPAEPPADSARLTATLPPATCPRSTTRWQVAGWQATAPAHAARRAGRWESAACSWSSAASSGGHHGGIVTGSRTSIRAPTPGRPCCPGFQERERPCRIREQDPAAAPPLPGVERAAAPLRR